MHKGDQEILDRLKKGDQTAYKELFDFDYKWEAYIPKKKRVYGHYVLPILYGDSFIGRIEPVLSGDGILEIRGFWIEENYKWNKVTSSAFWPYLEEFKRYLNAKNIKWSCKSPLK